jgi:hypothetical protein
VTFVLTAAALTVVCAEVFVVAEVVSACVDLDVALVLVLALDEPDVSSVVSGVSSFGSVEEPLVWAPPLLLMITPEPTSVLDEVDPDVDADVPDDDPVLPVLPLVPVVSVPPVVPVVPVDPVVPVVPDVAPPAAFELSPDDVEELDVPDPLDELDDVEPVDPPVVSATATP